MTRLALAITLLAILTFPALAGQSQTVKFFIPGMTGCPTCPYIVKSVLRSVDGVQQVETDYSTGIATITYDDQSITQDGLRDALQDYGYEAETVATEG